jgi:hypothetical protein
VKSIWQVIAVLYLVSSSSAYACEGEFAHHYMFSGRPFEKVPKGATQLLVTIPDQQKISTSRTDVILSVVRVLDGHLAQKSIHIDIKPNTSCSRNGFPSGEIYVVGFEIPYEGNCPLKDSDIAIFQPVSFNRENRISTNALITQNDFDRFRSNVQKPISCTLAKMKVERAFGDVDLQNDNSVIKRGVAPAMIFLLLFVAWRFWKRRSG